MFYVETMGLTLNKDGTPRKIGSGKTKGAGCFAKIKWQQLREFISEDDEILVSRVWLREVGALNQRKGSKKKLSALSIPSTQTPKIIEKAPLEKTVKKTENSLIPSDSPKQSEEEEYNPPIFANFGSIKKY